MKYIKIIVLTVFLCLIFVPVLFINHEPEAISYIDNRMLAENPFSEEMRSRDDANLSRDIENYLNDRIGFRDEMILANTVLNDRLFNEMVHPTYSYGKDDYVFFKDFNSVPFTDYHVRFADMVYKVQSYCQDRDIPFLFVFEPVKNSVYTEYLPEGLNYDNSWVQSFFAELDKRNINYIDNTELLIEMKEQGKAVFNKKYDAGHWSNLGGFYGVNNILEALQKDFPGIALNRLEEFDIKDELHSTLPVSRFPINETEAVFAYKGSVRNLSELYDKETYRHKQYRYFNYIVNDLKLEHGSPKTLIFQGSYMNGVGHKFLEAGLGEYIAVHDYQNILNLPYYFNLFQPECVIFEVAEYTLEDGYFPYDAMGNINWNPVLEDYCKSHEIADELPLSSDNLTVSPGDVFTTISWAAGCDYDYVWLYAGTAFDMFPSKDEAGKYKLSIPKEVFSKNHADFYILASLDGKLIPYHFS